MLLAACFGVKSNCVGTFCMCVVYQLVWFLDEEGILLQAQIAVQYCFYFRT
jgi:hypothetical protein